MSDVARSNGRVRIREISALNEKEMVQVRLDDIDEYYFLLEHRDGGLFYLEQLRLGVWSEFREIHRELLSPKLLLKLALSHPLRLSARRLRAVS